MSRFTRPLLTGILVLVLIAVVLALGLIFLIRRPFPQVSGEIRLSGLEGPVDVYRDPYGIPHIYAQTSHDLFFSQGYIHAQDRFWQMDFWRHIGSGRLAELLGDSAVDTDQFLRTLGWERIAQADLQSASEEHRAVLQAYADGVNAYLADHSGSQLSLEYAILELINSGYQVEPWQPVHTLTWAKVMAWDLGGNLTDEISRAILLKTLTPKQVDEIMPPYPEDSPVILPGFELMGSAPLRPSPASSLVPALAPAFAALGRQMASLEPVLGPQGEGLGSNSWVLSGERTASGLPLLANDPHLGEQMPAIWYQIGLHCTPQGVECPYNVAGFSFAGAPGVIIGHNDRIAWGFTNVGPDVMDLYIEKINPDNPDQYEVNGQWVNMERVEETIRVGGGEVIPLTIRQTRHGPIISESYGRLEDFAENSGVELPGEFAISLRWTALGPTKTLSAILGFNSARNFEEFRQAARDLAVPSQNLVYADVDGNIGYQMPGWIPIRQAGHDGSLPVPGWSDDYEWQGYIPFEELPYRFNPPQGYIVTANNAVVDSRYPYLISTEWDYGYRSRRIIEMIESASGPVTGEDLRQMQGDNKDLNAEALVPVLLELPLDEERLEAARALLEGWDYQAHMESAPAALFNVFWKHLLDWTFSDQLPESEWPSGDSRWVTVVAGLLEQPESAWWDDFESAEVETRDDVLHLALADAVGELEQTQGNDPQKWAWGDLHTVTFHNGSLGQSGIAPIEALFNRGPFPASGGAAIVNATRWDALEGYEVRSLPSMRMIVDLGNLSASLTVFTTGQSGHAYHEHYVDLAELWRRIEYYPMLWERPQVEAQAESHLRLLP